MKEATYGGCGCAGGEVVTLKDEGTMINGDLTRRPRRSYSDALGRVWKTETYRWDAVTVDSSVVSVYDANDQVQFLRQYEGPAPQDAALINGPTNTCRQTVISYDGYGRQRTRHVPQQQVDPTNSASTDHTTWDYNDDDTIQKITDARGASATYSYNNRRLVNVVTYNAPSINAPGLAIPATPQVSFDYDAAGNRLWMNEDNQRRVTYHYDGLSRMDWEERQFSGLSGVYRLSYEYNLAGEVKQVSDQTGGTSLNTVYDNIGRVTGVNTVGYNGSTAEFATQIQHRASGAVKSMAYGNNTTLNLGYNARGLIANYSINGAILPGTNPPQVTIAAVYQYHAAGQLKFVQDQAANNSIRDRAYKYDQAGRLAEALSGSEARNFVNGTSGGATDGPYRQSYTYDAWNNTVTQSGRYWSRNVTSTTNYNQLNRNPDWSYDAEGNLISRNPVPYAEEFPRYSYDAAGRDAKVEHTEICVIQPQNVFQFNVYTQTRKYDGDGQVVGYVQTHTVNGTMAAGWPKTVYHLRSTVLGGRAISNYDGQGGWIDTQVLRQSHRSLLREQLVRWRSWNTDPSVAVSTESSTA